MNQLNAWFNYQATLKILIFSVLAGAVLPGMFALGIRLQAGTDVAAGAISTEGHAPRRNPVLIAIAWAIYALVVAVIIIGVLYIARDFIAHQTGQAFLGAKPK